MSYLDNNGLLYFWQKIKAYVSGAVPTKTSDLTNDSGFITASDVPEGSAASTTTPKMDGTAAVGSETAFARGDHVHPTDTSRAAAAHEHAAGDITSGEIPVARGGTGKSSVAAARASWGFGYGTCSIAAATAAKTVSISNFALVTGAMVMVKFSNANTASTPTLNVNSTGAKAIRRNGSTFKDLLAIEYLFVYDGTYWEVVAGIDTTYDNASSSAAGLMSSTDKSKLDAFGAASSYALKTDISGAYIYKGSVATESGLPSSGLTAGDVYNIVAASSYGGPGMNVAWTGSAWDALGEMFTITATTNAEIDTIVAS